MFSVKCGGSCCMSSIINAHGLPKEKFVVLFHMRLLLCVFDDEIIKVPYS